MIDNEKFPDSPLRECWNNSIFLISRYHKIAEYRSMIEMSQNLPTELAIYVLSIYCDSKACASYGVEVWPRTSLKAARLILENVRATLLRKDGGFNALIIGTEQFAFFGKRLAEADSEWIGP